MGGVADSVCASKYAFTLDVDIAPPVVCNVVLFVISYNSVKFKVNKS